MTLSDDEWQISETDYPRGGSVGERLRLLVGYAILAPSGHNTQPWLFRVTGEALELIADRTRCLPVVDPFDRALTISCGAALGHLRTAMRYFGHDAEVTLLPEPEAAPDLLARIAFGRPIEPSASEAARFHAITQRRTTRLSYPQDPLPAGLASRLSEAARSDECTLGIIEEGEAKLAAAQLVAAGDRAQFGNPAFRRELAAWVHSRRSATRDGMSGAAFGMPDVLSSVGGLVIRTFDMGDGIGAKDEQLAAGSPALLVLATPGEDPESWLRAGLALSSILLEITAAGWTSAYLNQPVETPELRARLGQIAQLPGHPQLLIRIGRAPLIEPSVRRPVAQVMVE